MNRINLLILTAIAFIAFACGNKSSNENKSAPPALAADVIVLKMDSIHNNYYGTGSLLPNEEVELKAQISGRIMDVLFTEGERVHKNQLLLKIDDREWQAQRLRFKADLDNAEKDLLRKKALIEIKGLSQEELDNAENRVNMLKANIAELDVKIDNANIKAPFDGRLGLRMVSRGDFISTGSSVVRISDNSKLKLDFSVPEQFANMVVKGQEVKFYISNSKQEYIATVYATEPRIHESNRSLDVRALVGNSHENILPGSFANVVLTLEELNNALLVPTEAIVLELNATKVWRINSGTAEKIEVETGVRFTKNVQLSKGVNAGDSILITGLLQVREGMPLVARSVKTIQPENFK